MYLAALSAVQDIHLFVVPAPVLVSRTLQYIGPGVSLQGTEDGIEGCLAGKFLRNVGVRQVLGSRFNGEAVSVAAAGSVVNSAYFKQKLAGELRPATTRPTACQPPASRLRPVLSGWVTGASVFP